MAGSPEDDNFDPNANKAYLVYIPSAVFVVICPTLMGLRIWARLRRNGKMGADDWTAIAALVSTVNLCHTGHEANGLYRSSPFSRLASWWVVSIFPSVSATSH